MLISFDQKTLDVTALSSNIDPHTQFARPKIAGAFYVLAGLGIKVPAEIGVRNGHMYWS